MCLCMRMHLCMCVCVYECICMHVCVKMNVCVSEHACMCICACMCVCMRHSNEFNEHHLLKFCLLSSNHNKIKQYKLISREFDMVSVVLNSIHTQEIGV